MGNMDIIHNIFRPYVEGLTLTLIIYCPAPTESSQAYRYMPQVALMGTPRDGVRDARFRGGPDLTSWSRTPAVPRLQSPGDTGDSDTIRCQSLIPAFL